jgi:hypothetical protein
MASGGHRAGKILPWHPRASAATVFRRLPTTETLLTATAFLIAKPFPTAIAEVAGPSPVLAWADLGPPFVNPKVACSFLATPP